MLAVMPSRQQEAPYFQNPTMDPSMVDLFTFPIDNLSGFGQSNDTTRVTQSYYEPPLYAEDIQKPGFPSLPGSPPATTTQAPEPLPSLSSASAPSIASTSSSAIGSPYSATQGIQEGWMDTNHGLSLTGAMSDLFSNDQMINTLDADAYYQKKGADNFVDPSWIQPISHQPNDSSPVIYPEQPSYAMGQPVFAQQSPEASPLPTLESLDQNDTEEPKQPFSSQATLSANPPYQPTYNRRSSASSTHSSGSRRSPSASSVDDDTKGRCPHPECGRPFKDLKAHMLTHQAERPEKCPIVNCEYHIKGFARKYDKNRHTLTHYKGTMVCGFCPGSGSPAEKSFNRADVFKRHLTSVHGVEQTPPNCRRKNSNSKSTMAYSSDSTGKCSTCTGTFSNPQEFYEHLDDCVLRVVQQEEPSEAINQKRLAEMDSDEEVKKTMEKHKLVDNPAGTGSQSEDDGSPTSNQKSGKGSINSTKGNPSSRSILGKNAVTKHSTQSTNSGNNKLRPMVSRRRNNRDFYPQSWGCPASSMKTKKRVLCVFDGPRRLWKDEMMLDNEFEVRVKLPGGAGDGTNRDAYITDLDIETMKRAEGVFSATTEERGPWSNGLSTRLIGQPAMLLPGLSRPEEEVDLEEIMRT